MQSIKSLFFYYVLKYKVAQLAKRKLSLAQMREQDAITGAMMKMPLGIVVERDLLQGRHGEWLRPEGMTARGILLYLHGGAYIQGSIESHRALVARLAIASASNAYIFDYRLAPEHPFPAALDDAVATYLALRQAHPGIPIVVAGDSAGGGLTLALTLCLQQENVAAPAALALMSPWTDLTGSNATHQTKAGVDPIFPNPSVAHQWAAMYAGVRPLTNPLISPQFARAGGLPPTLIHVGEHEILLDDARVFAKNMANEGGKVTLKVYPGMWHVWQAFGGFFREADQSITELGMFLKSHLERTHP